MHYEQSIVAVGNHSAELLLRLCLDIMYRTKAAMLGHLGNMHGKCPMSDRYFKLWYLYSNPVLEGQVEVAIGIKGAERAELGIF